MFLDASAIVAIVNCEPKSRELLLAIDGAHEPKFCSPLAIYEAIAGFARCKPNSAKNHKDRIVAAQKIITIFLERFDVAVVTMNPEIVAIAIDAMAKFGWGSGHPAKLNMGDCFAYAMAKSLKVQLLFVGNDFIHTDIKSALANPAI